MNEELLDQLFDRLEPIAEKLGQGAEFLWHVAVRQVYLSSVGWFLFAAALIGLGLTMRRLAKREAARWQTLEDKMLERVERGIYQNRGYSGLTDRAIKDALDGWKFPWVALDWLGLAIAVTGVIPFYSGITRLVNPGFYAISKMMEAVGW